MKGVIVTELCSQKNEHSLHTSYLLQTYNRVLITFRFWGIQILKMLVPSYPTRYPIKARAATFRFLGKFRILAYDLHPYIFTWKRFGLRLLIANSCPNLSMGVCQSSIRVGDLFIKYTAVRMNSGQRSSGRRASMRRRLAFYSLSHPQIGPF